MTPNLPILQTDLSFNYAAVTGSPTASVVTASPNVVRVQFNRPVNVAGVTASRVAGAIYAGYATNTASAVANVDTAVNGMASIYDITFASPILGGTATIVVGNNTTTPIKDGFSNSYVDQSLTATITVDTTKPVLSSNQLTSNSTLNIVFSKDMYNTGSSAVTNAANYTLLDSTGNVITGATTGFSGIVDGSGHPATVTYNAGTFTATVNFGGNLPSGSYSVKVSGLTDNTALRNGLDTVNVPVSITTAFVMSSAVANTGNTSLLVTFSHAIATSGAGSALLASNYKLDMANSGNLINLPDGSVLTASGTNGVLITFPAAQSFVTASKVYALSTITDATGSAVSVTGQSQTITAASANTIAASNIRKIKLVSPTVVTFEVTKPLTGTLTAGNFSVTGGAAVTFGGATYSNQSLSDGTYGSIVTLSVSSGSFATTTTNGHLVGSNGTECVAFDAAVTTLQPVNGTANAGTVSLYYAGANVVADKSAPSISTVTTVDSDTDGKLDGLSVVFSEPVNISDMNQIPFTVSGGYTITSVTPDLTATTYPTSGTKTATNTFILNIGEKLVGDTAALPTLTMTKAVNDPYSNTLAAGATVSATVDGAAPIMMSAVATSATTLVVTYSEPVAITTPAVGEFTVAAALGAAADTGTAPVVGTGANTNQITLTFAAGSFVTGTAYPTGTLAYAQGAAAAQVKDAAAIASPNKTLTGITSGF